MGKDRKDARRVGLPAMMQCAIDLKPGRANSDVYINRKMDVTELVKYIEKKKADGIRYTYFNAFMTAIGKVIYNRPKLNRFVANRHMYEHKEVSLAFVAKMKLNDMSEEIMLIVKIAPEDTIASVTDKLAKQIDNLRGEKVRKEGANSAMDVLAKLPNPIRVPVFGVIKALDKRGKLPTSLTGSNIYYSSMIVSNLGSIHCGAIYHNLTNFGSCSSLATMGEIKPEPVYAPDGSMELRQFCEFGITLDERIGDGFYFAKSCRLIEHILSHPELLEERADAPITVD